MKARKFIKRDRTTVGRATGVGLVCQFTFPAANENYEVRPLNNNSAKAVDTVRKFVSKHLQDRRLLLDEASFSIYAEVRVPSGSLRRNRLAKWKYGDDLNSVFEQASQVWKTLEQEEDWDSVEIDFMADKL